MCMVKVSASIKTYFVNWSVLTTKYSLIANNYIHTYIHTYVRTYVHTYIHTYIHTCMHFYAHVSIVRHLICLGIYFIYTAKICLHILNAQILLLLSILHNKNVMDCKNSDKIYGQVLFSYVSLWVFLRSASPKKSVNKFKLKKFRI